MVLQNDFFIGKTSDTRRIWTVEAYQWGIEGHHYPHTDNGPPQGQPGHWAKQNKREISNNIQFKLFDPKLFAFHFRFLSYNDDNYDDNNFILHCTLLLFCWTYTYVRHLHMICTIALYYGYYLYIFSTNQKERKYIVDTLIRIILSIPINSYNVYIPQ